MQQKSLGCDQPAAEVEKAARDRLAVEGQVEDAREVVAEAEEVQTVEGMNGGIGQVDVEAAQRPSGEIINGERFISTFNQY